MAVQQRQEKGSGYHLFSSRLKEDVYNQLNDWAWENRLTFARACSVLLAKAIAAELGEKPYSTESELSRTTR